MKEKRVIFLKYSLLEELESTNKGNVSAEQILTLINKKKYNLEEAVIFKEKLDGNSNKNLVGTILTISEVNNKGYDLYMDTVIIGDCVYRVVEGFKGTLVEEIFIKENDIKIIPNEDEFNKKEKTNEQLLADLMLGNIF